MIRISHHPSAAHRLPRPAVLGLALLLLLGLAVPPAGAQGDTDADRILGLWKTEPDENGEYVHVEITGEHGVYHGSIVWMSAPLWAESEGPQWAGKPKVDRNNPDEALRTRPIVGLPLVSGFRYDGGERWSGGTIYDPKKGKTYSCRMTLAGADRLDLRGYVLGMPLLGRTTTWTRVTDGP